MSSKITKTYKYYDRKRWYVIFHKYNFQCGEDKIVTQTLEDIIVVEHVPKFTVDKNGELSLGKLTYNLKDVGNPPVIIVDGNLF
jgi:predicted nucleotide-binding protein (sugar kinase/HSP70/actin superfamily)